jgi:hypothetical protein
VPRPYDDDDEDIEDEDFDIARRPGRRENSGAASRLMGPAIALMVAAIVSLVVFAVACPINFISILNKPEIPGKEAQRLGNFIGAGVCIPLFMISNLIVAIGGFLQPWQLWYGDERGHLGDRSMYQPVLPARYTVRHLGLGYID